MDGGSTDGSLAVLREAGASVQWESRSDGGQSEALNRAFAKSSGDIIGWVNSDDAYYRPTVIAEVVEAFTKRPEVDVFYGHCALVNCTYSPQWVRVEFLPLIETYNAAHPHAKAATGIGGSRLP